jgi:23S rRNA (cytidine1920-2'-O)/16S rRNA (cytidine1409-2'-O)-methyltransferase
MAKIRLDILMVENNLVANRTKAQALITSGLVYHNQVKLDKAGHLVNQDIQLTIREKEHNFVSRGGMKLAKGLEYFNISVKDKICIDIGASTGGFTDVLLNNYAQKIYAVDVGYGQLDWSLRNNAKVVVLEKTNARYLDNNIIQEAPEIIVCDASFISIKTVLPATLALAEKEAILIALIKPQFEVGKDRLGKNGVVKDPLLHQEVCDDISKWLTNIVNWQVLGITQSPITGPKGNIEFLIGAKKC